MAEDYEDSGTENTGLLALADVLGGNRYTTKEAHDFANKILQGYEGESTALDSTEDDYYAKLDANATKAKETLAAARKYIEGRRYNKSRTMFQIAAAAGRPTKSGRFGESLGNISGAMVDDIDAREKMEDARQSGMLEMDQGVLNIDQKLAEARIAALQKRRAQGDKMATEALKIAGRELRNAPGGGSSRGPFGKQAIDEGLIPDTPQFVARVKQLQDEDFRLRQQSAGVDAPQDGVDEAQSAQIRAMDLGIPFLARDPLENYSIKGREKRRVQIENDAQEQLRASKEATGAATKQIADFDRFEALNKDLPYTGPLVGWLTQFTDTGSEMKPITKGFARSQRIPGEGPMSNYDAQTLEGMAPSVFKDPKVNTNIIKGVKVIKERQKEYDRFLNDFFTSYGHVLGADQAWQEYVDNNPVFDPTKRGKFALNQKRMSYKQYFQIKNSEQDDDEFAGMTEEEKIAATTPAMADGGYVNNLADGGEPYRGPKYNRSKLQEISRALAQGATANWSDELLADDPEELARERAILEGYHDTDPVESLLAEVAGGVPGSVGAVYGGSKLLSRAGKSKSRLGKVAGALAKVVPKSNTGKLALAGAGSGAVAGAGSADDAEGTPTGVGIGATLGAMTGPLAGVMAKYGVKSAQGLYNLLTKSTVSAPDKKIIEAFMKDNIDIGAEGKRVVSENRRGIPSTLADADGRNVQLLRKEALVKGEDVDDSIVGLIKRSDEISDRATDQVNKRLKPDEYYDTMEKLRDALYTQADPLYQKAYADNPVLNSKVFAELLKNKDGKKAMKQALRVMKGEKAGTSDAVTGELKRPSLELMERTRRILRDMSEGAKEGGNATEMSRYFRLLSDRVGTELDNPKIVKGNALKEARAQYKDDHDVLAALEKGRDDFMKMDVNEFTKITDDMSFAEKDALRTGAAHALFDAIDATRDEANPLGKIVGNEKMRKKIRLLFDSDKEAEAFIEDMSRESGMYEQSKKLVSSVGKTRGKDEMGSVKDMAASLGLVGATQGFSSILGSPGWMTRIGNTMSRVARRSPKSTMEEVASTLHESNPVNIKDLSTILDKKLKRYTRQLQTQRRTALGTGFSVSPRSASTGPNGYLEEGEDGEYVVVPPDAFDEGYAEGGMVAEPDIMGLSGPIQTLTSAPSAAKKLPWATPPAGSTYGTGATRSRADVSGIDWERYGEGPGVNFFNNNAVPDAVYTTTPSGGGGSSPAAGGNTSNKSDLGTLIGGGLSLLNKGKKVKDLLSTIGIGGGGGGLSASSAAAAAAADPSMAAAMAPYASAPGAAAPSALSAMGPYLGLGAMGVAGAKIWSDAAKKDPARVGGSYDPSTGLNLNYDDQTQKLLAANGYTAADLTGMLTPYLDRYYNETDTGNLGDQMGSWMEKPEGYDDYYKTAANPKAMLGLGKKGLPKTSLDNIAYQLMSQKHGLATGKNDILKAIRSIPGYASAGG